jgi:hypothetical protein
MEDESILGGLGTAWDAATDAVDAVGDASYDVGAATYHHAAGTADYFLNDMDGAKEHDNARNEYMDDFGDQTERISDDIGINGMGDAYDAGVDAIDAAGDAAYDVGAATYHHAAGTADYFLNDMDGAKEHDNARNEYMDDFGKQTERISDDIGY